MNRITLALPLSLAASLLLSGCVYSHRASMTPTGRTVVVKEPAPSKTIVVRESPPPPRQETQGVAPSPTHVWVPGYWAHTNNRWVWIPGHWEVRPRASAMWVPGHWDKDTDGRGWVWTPGHWE